MRSLSKTLWYTSPIYFQCPCKRKLSHEYWLCSLRLGMSLLCFFLTYYALSNSQETYQLCRKKCPLCSFLFCNKNALFSCLTTTNTYSTFRVKSEGLGDSSLLNNEVTQMLTSWLGFWESSGLLLELSTAAGPLLLLVLGPLLPDFLLLLGPAADYSIGRALHVNYSCKTAQLFPNYAFCFCGPIIPEIMPAY